MRDLGAALADDGTERAGIYLTNALTDWEGTGAGSQTVAFPELQEERDRAGRVKQDTPILVILGNPPYNGFAGMAVDEESELVEAYRSTRRVRRPEGQGLNDLYVRFFRMAERRIEKTGQGVVCLISNYSWLDGLSFTGMRERYLETFDAVWIDCLNGDRYKTGKVAPDGSPDPSIFSTESDPVGIQVGTAIATLIRKADHAPAVSIGFRHLWGKDKPAKLLETAAAEPETLYHGIEPALPLGLPFFPVVVSKEWFDWPGLPELFPTSFPGVTTNRDSFLVDIDLDRLKARVGDYFDIDLSHEQIGQRYPVAMKTTTSIQQSPRSVRDARLGRGGPDKNRFIRYCHRPFDTRWLYWEAESGLLARPCPDYREHVFGGNMWVEARQRESRDFFSRGTVVRYLAGDFGNGRSHFFPAWLRDQAFGHAVDNVKRSPNLSLVAQRYLDVLGLSVEGLFYHVLAVLHDTDYREANAGALKMEWPRISLPGWPDGKAGGASEALANSAARGRKLANLFDADSPCFGRYRGHAAPGNRRHRRAHDGRRSQHVR